MHEIRLFSGKAASFKGGRSYVHGTDMVPFLDCCAASLWKNATVSEVEFKKPLTTRGVLVINPENFSRNDKSLNAQGTLHLQDRSKIPFIVFASPIPVENEDREFFEYGIWDSAKFLRDSSYVSVDRSKDLTAAEHLSSLMKLLCSSLLPEHRRWWFVRLQKSTPLPEDFSIVEIFGDRILANRMVSARFSFDGEERGQIDFVGAST